MPPAPPLRSSLQNWLRANALATHAAGSLCAKLTMFGSVRCVDCEMVHNGAASASTGEITEQVVCRNADLRPL